MENNINFMSAESNKKTRLNHFITKWDEIDPNFFDNFLEVCADSEAMSSLLNAHNISVPIRDSEITEWIDKLTEE